MPEIEFKPEEMELVIARFRTFEGEVLPPWKPALIVKQTEKLGANGEWKPAYEVAIQLGKSETVFRLVYCWEVAPFDAKKL